MHLRHQGRGAFGQSSTACDRRKKVQRFAVSYLQCEPDILGHTEVLEKVVALKCATHAQAADALGRGAGDITVAQQDAARRWLELAADLIDQAGLASAVRTNDDVSLTLADRKRNVIRYREAAKRFVEAVDAQNVHFCARHNPSCPARHIPPGKNITQQMKVMPMTASQCSLYELTTVFISRKTAAPTAGPINVPAPPSIVIIKMSPEAVQ